MKTRRNLKIAAATILAAAVIAAPAAAYAANTDSNLTAQQNAELTSITEQTAVQAEQTADQKGPMGSGFGGMDYV